MLYIRAEGRNDDFIALHLELQVGQDFNHLLLRDVGAQEAVGPVCIQVDSGRLVVGVVHVDDAVHYFAGSQQLDQLAGTHHCRQTVLCIQAFFKTTGGFGSHAQLFGGDTHRAALEAGGLKDNGVGVFIDAAVLAAHDARYCACLFAVGNHQHILAEGSVHSVKRLDGFAGNGIADDNLVVFDILDVKGVHRLSVLEHDIVCDVNDVVDWTNSAGAQTLSHPTRGRTDFNIFHDLCGIAWAQLWVAHLYRQIVVDVAAAAFDLRSVHLQLFAEGNSSFPCQTQHRQAVRAVWGDFKFHTGVVAADGRSNVLSYLAVLLQQEDAVLGSVRKIPFGQIELCNRAHHAVGHHASELTLCDFDSVWQLGFVQSCRNHIAYMDIGGSGDNLDRLLLPNIQLADDQVVGIRVWLHRQNLSYHYIFYIFKFGGPALHLGAGHTHRFGKIPHGDVSNIYIIFQPSDRKIHDLPFLSCFTRRLPQAKAPLSCSMNDF